MNWATYKLLCDRPDYWSRWMLEQCCHLLVQLNEPSLRDVLEQAMRREPLLTPADHTGADATQMFRLQLSPEIRQNMLAAIQQAHDCELTTPHTQARGLGGFVQAWQEYASYEG